MPPNSFNFTQTTMPAGAPAPKADRGAYVVTIKKIEINEADTGASLIMELHKDNMDPSGRQIPTGLRPIRKFVGWPKAEEPDGWQAKTWLKIIHVGLNIPEATLKARPFAFNVVEQLGKGNVNLCVDYTPDVSEREYTTKEGKTKTGHDDNVWFLTIAECTEVQNRLRAEYALDHGGVAPTNGAGAAPLTATALPLGGMQTAPPVQPQVAPIQPVQPQVAPLMAQPVQGGIAGFAGGMADLPGLPGLPGLQ